MNPTWPCVLTLWLVRLCKTRTFFLLQPLRFENLVLSHCDVSLNSINRSALFGSTVLTGCVAGLLKQSHLAWYLMCWVCCPCQNEVSLLRNEVAHLKQLLLAHKDCPVTNMQKKTAYLGELSLLVPSSYSYPTLDTCACGCSLFIPVVIPGSKQPLVFLFVSLVRN